MSYPRGIWPPQIGNKVIVIRGVPGTYFPTIHTVTDITGEKLRLDNMEVVYRDNVYQIAWKFRIEEILEYCNYKNKDRNPYDMLGEMRELHKIHNPLKVTETLSVTDEDRKRIARELRETGIYKPTRPPKKKNSWKEL